MKIDKNKEYYIIIIDGKVLSYYNRDKEIGNIGISTFSLHSLGMRSYLTLEDINSATIQSYLLNKKYKIVPVKELNL